MGYRNVVNDGAATAPRLRMQYNLWSLTGLPRGGQEWSLPEKLDQVAAAGFEGLECAVTSAAEADEIAALLRDRNLAFGYATFVSEPDQLVPEIEHAHRMQAQYITAQVNGALKSTPQIVDTLGEMYKLVNGAGLPFFVETHRGRVTQDLRRTGKVLKQFKKLRFTGDFSHYIVTGELGGAWPDEVWQALTPIAEHCGNFHGRIGYGEQVQNDIGDGFDATCQQFRKLWAIGMRAWLGQARPGDILPFCSELGPPGYSICDLSGVEISDRWTQSLVIKRLAEEAWADARLGVDFA
jgi:sugar phosphate isomerase/epimerase